MDFTKYRNKLTYKPYRVILQELYDADEARGLEVPVNQFDAYRRQLEGAARTKAFEARRAYEARDAELLAQFKRDAFAELGWGELPTRLGMLFWQKAWADGHANGYSEVFSSMEDLDEIVQHLLTNYEL